MSEQEKPANQGELKLKVFNASELALDPEVKGVFEWLHEKVIALPEMKVKDSNATDGDKWKAELTPEGQVKEIRGAQFSIGGIDVTSKFSWHQPILIQNTEKAQTQDGEIELSGVVLLIKNSKEETFLTVEQEPVADAQVADGKERHPIARTPVQTSVTKLRQLMEGQEKVDPTLYSVLQSLAESTGKSMNAIISELSLSKASIDANRMKSNVYYGVLSLNEQMANKLQERVPSGRWCSKKEIAALTLMGVANGHLQLGVSVNDAHKLFTSS